MGWIFVFLLPESPGRLGPAITARVPARRDKMKMQANKSSIRNVGEWMNEGSPLCVFLSPLINAFHLLH